MSVSASIVQNNISVAVSASGGTAVTVTASAPGTIPVAVTGGEGPQGPTGPAGPPTTDASLLTSGTLPDARLSANIARTSDVTAAVNAVVDAAPNALNTLNELAAALNDDANFASTVTTALAGKSNLGHIHSAEEVNIDPSYISPAPTTFDVGIGEKWLSDLISDIDGAIAARATASHSHGNITTDGKIGSTSGLPIITTTGGVLTVGAFGTMAGTFCVGNDARLTDAREWSADTVSQAEAEDGTATTRRAWTALRVFQAVAAWWNASAAKTKLDGIQAGATANSTDAQLRDRSTHTGEVVTADLADAAVTTAKLADGAVTDAKVTSITASKVSDFASAVAAASPEEVVEYQTTSAFPATGNSSLLYIATDPSRAYRWTGSQYVEVGPAALYVSSHTHAAGDITSGTIAAARLGSGTADESTFLRGDQTFAAPPVTSVDGATGAVTVTKSEVYEFTATTKPASATGSNGSYAWTIPAGAKAVTFYCVGAGGGGGSGRRGASGTACCGGGGGGPGGWSEVSYEVAKLSSSSLSVTVPAGGAGGAAPTADDTNGNAGSDVNTNSTVNIGATRIAMAFSATGGQGGTSSASVNSGGAQWTSQFTPNVASTTPQGRSGAAGGGGGNNTFTSGHGGGGGGADASNNQYAGGSGGGLPIMVGAGGSATAGTAGGGAGANGVIYNNRVGTGGAGGGGSSTAGGGAGGNGAFPGGGGGGGGGGRNGFTGGAGGNGGGGLVRITVWY